MSADFLACDTVVCVCGPDGGFAFGPEFHSRASGENDECDWVDWLGITR